MSNVEVAKQYSNSSVAGGAFLVCAIGVVWYFGQQVREYGSPAPQSGAYEVRLMAEIPRNGIPTHVIEVAKLSPDTLSLGDYKKAVVAANERCVEMGQSGQLRSASAPIKQACSVTASLHTSLHPKPL